MAKPEFNSLSPSVAERSCEQREEPLQANASSIPLELNDSEVVQSDSYPMPAFFTRIQRALADKEVKINSSIQIFLGTKSILKQRVGEPPTQRDELNVEQIQRIQIALDNPQQFQGAFRILVDNEPVYHVRNGIVLQDQLGLSQRSKPSQGQPLESSAAGSGKGDSEPAVSLFPAQSEQPTLEQKVDRLMAQIQSQNLELLQLRQRLELMEQHLSASAPAENDRLGHWLNRITQRVQEVVRTVLERLDAAKETIRGRAAAMAIAGLDTTAVTLTRMLGEEQPDGSTVLQSQTAPQRWVISSDPQRAPLRVEYQVALGSPPYPQPQFQQELETLSALSQYVPTRRELIVWWESAKHLGQPEHEIARIKALGCRQLQDTAEEQKPSSKRNLDFVNPNFTLSKSDFQQMRKTVGACVRQSLAQLHHSSDHPKRIDLER